MTFRSSSVFQAICYRHACQYGPLEGASRHGASLVCISGRGARIKVDDAAALPGEGSLVRLAPNFLGEVANADIEARVDRVRGTDVHLAFTSELALPGSRLYQLTSR